MIQILNRLDGHVIYRSEMQTIKEAIEDAVAKKANLQYANLQYANLQYADLRYANLQCANLQCADLRYANLQYANLQYANLQCADLRYANLWGWKVSKAAVFSALYKYIVSPFITESGEEYVKMGCFTRTVAEWDADFWNNPQEFPNDGSSDSEMRLAAYQFAKRWIEINRD